MRRGKLWWGLGWVYVVFQVIPSSWGGSVLWDGGDTGCEVGLCRVPGHPASWGAICHIPGHPVSLAWLDDLCWRNTILLE